MSLTPTNEESVQTGKKIFVKKKHPPSGSGIACVDSFRLLTASIRFMWKVETKMLFYSKIVTLLMFNLSNLLPRSTLIVPFV